MSGGRSCVPDPEATALFYGSQGNFVVQSREEQIIELLEEIRDTLQGRRGFIAMPSAAECLKYGGPGFPPEVKR